MEITELREAFSMLGLSILKVFGMICCGCGVSYVFDRMLGREKYEYVDENSKEA